MASRIADDYKRQEVGKIAARTENGALKLAETIGGRAQKLASTYTTPLRVQAPMLEPGVLEAKLANTRHDVELAVRNVELKDIPDVLEDLVNEGDPLTTYMILGTPYPERLLAGMGAHDLVRNMWKRMRSILERVAAGDGAPRGADRAQRLTQVSSLLDGA